MANPITKADFETAWGRPLTDAQYEQLRMGLQMGMLDKGVNSGGAYDHRLPRSTASMPEEQRNAIARLNWLAAGRPNEPGSNLFDAAPGQQTQASKPKAPSRSDGSKPMAKRADTGDGGPLDDRATPVQSPTSVYAGNGKGVKDWQKKAVRPGYGWVDVDNGAEPPSAFAPEPDNGWEGGQAPAPAKIVLGQGQAPAAPVPQPAPGDPAPKAVPATGGGGISAAQKKAAADVAELEKEAATLDDPYAAAAAKGKADVLALEKEAAKLPAAKPKPQAAPATPATATAQNWNSAPPAAKQKAWQQASLDAGKSLTGGEFQMQLQNAQHPPAAPPPAAMSSTPVGPAATPQAPAGAPSKAQVEATLGKSITDQEYVAYVQKMKAPQYQQVPQSPVFKGLVF